MYSLVFWQDEIQALYEAIGVCLRCIVCLTKPEDFLIICRVSGSIVAEQMNRPLGPVG